jgi:hypothetical protein
MRLLKAFKLRSDSQVDMCNDDSHAAPPRTFHRNLEILHVRRAAESTLAAQRSRHIQDYTRGIHSIYVSMLRAQAEQLRQKQSTIFKI